jgi:hypothetical protein
MDSILKAVKAAAKAFLEAEKNRKAITEALERAFDKYIEPINLPVVPDYIVDPLVRKQIEPLVKIMCDGLVAWLEGKTNGD